MPIVVKKKRAKIFAEAPDCNPCEQFYFLNIWLFPLFLLTKLQNQGTITHFMALLFHRSRGPNFFFQSATTKRTR